ncbi:MAG: hypothetical protein ACFE0R_02820 [Salinarimonas sp.]
MQDLNEVARFLDRHEAAYRSLLGAIRDVCSAVKNEPAGAMITDIHSRASHQAGNEFKKMPKIVSKLRARGKEITETNLLELNDIVGLTVVVLYPDVLDDVIDALCMRLGERRITTTEPERKEDKRGYYATHMICSQVSGGIVRRCEIQFKTSLHDAWSRKTHDLTYKPPGRLDPRLDALMASVANSLELLEQQSVLIRDIIQASWDVEAETVKEVRRLMFDFVRSVADRVWSEPHATEVRALYDDIEAKADTLAQLPETDPSLEHCIAEIDRCCADEAHLRHGWMIAGRLAALRPRGDLNRFSLKHAEQFMSVARALLDADRIIDKELVAVPTMLYALGEIEEAITYSERLLEPGRYPKLSDAARDDIELNRLCFLTEREFQAPTRDAAHRRRLRMEIEDGLERQRQRGDEAIQSAVLDAIGLARITFGETRAEIRAGIDECIAAVVMEKGDIRIAEAYREMHLQFGWRRYFELQIQETHAARRPRART